MKNKTCKKKNLKKINNKSKKGGGYNDYGSPMFSMSIDSGKSNGSRMSISELMTPGSSSAESSSNSVAMSIDSQDEYLERGTPQDHQLTTNVFADNLQPTDVPKLIKTTEYTSKMLKTMCSESGVCLDFGDKNNLIKSFFENFDFKYSSLGKRIGAPSNNGAVIKVPYEKNGFITQTALKLATTQEADNLWYEHQVGTKFINNYVKIFPCFTETYGLLRKFKNNNIYKDILKKLTDNKKVKLKNSMFENEIFEIDRACVNNHLYAVLIQYFDGFNTIYNSIKNDISVFERIEKEVPTLFYQGYFALDCLRKNYTHFDLHLGNFGYYQPYKSKYIIMTYHSDNGKTYTFPTRYITKIIDYGRSHFFLNDSDNTENIVNQICTYKSCGKGNCGIDNGFSCVSGYPNESADSPTSSFHWINPLYKNESHDLRAYANFHEFFKRFFNIGDIVYKGQFGTPEDLNYAGDNNIRNVTDMRAHLEGYISYNQDILNQIEKEFINNGLTKAGELHVYNDMRPYEWILS